MTVENPQNRPMRPLDLFDEYTHQKSQLVAAAENLAEAIEHDDGGFKPLYERSLVKYAGYVLQLRRALMHERPAPTDQ